MKSSGFHTLCTCCQYASCIKQQLVSLLDSLLTQEGGPAIIQPRFRQALTVLRQREDL